MGKHQREVKAHKSQNLHSLQQTEIIDDNLLPDAEEIIKLAQVDPNILTWLKSRAEKEQEFRHNFNNNRFTLVDSHNKREHNTTRLSLSIYFILVGGCIYFSYLLISQGHTLQGSIFGGTAAILALAVLVSRRNIKDDSASKKQ